jgi:hypothetical protein
MIEFDFSDYMPRALIGVLSENLAEAVLSELITVARARWVRLAGAELKSTAQTYIEGIGEIESAPGERSIALRGWLANKIEDGLDAYNLRKNILYNPNARARKPILDKDGAQVGWYATIPFRHGTPGTTGLAGTPMGSSYGPRGELSRRAFGGMDAGRAAEFGKEIYEAAKKLKARQPKMAKMGRSGAQMQVGMHPGARMPAGTAGAALLATHHKTDIYAGMRKERKAYKHKTSSVHKTGRVTMQSQYMTFRRISTTSDTGWRHPGIEARHFADRVTEHISKIAGATVKKALNEALK